MIWNSASFINTVVKEFKEAMHMCQDRNCRGKSVSVKLLVIVIIDFKRYPSKYCLMQGS